MERWGNDRRHQTVQSLFVAACLTSLIFIILSMIKQRNKWATKGLNLRIFHALLFKIQDSQTHFSCFIIINLVRFSELSGQSGFQKRVSWSGESNWIYIRQPNGCTVNIWYLWCSPCLWRPAVLGGGSGTSSAYVWSSCCRSCPCWWSSSWLQRTAVTHLSPWRPLGAFRELND